MSAVSPIPKLNERELSDFIFGVDNPEESKIKDEIAKSLKFPDKVSVDPNAIKQAIKDYYASLNKACPVDDKMTEKQLFDAIKRNPDCFKAIYKQKIGKKWKWVENVFGKTEDELEKLYKDSYRGKPPAVPSFDIATVDKLYDSEMKKNPKKIVSSEVANQNVHMVKGADAIRLSNSALGGIIMYASQFNALESLGKYKSPISTYPGDPTQGPQGVMPCGHSLCNRQFGREFNAFEQIIPDKKSRDESVKFGYVDWGENPEAFQDKLKNGGKEKLLIPAMWAKPEFSDHQVLQCFTAAPPCNEYGNGGNNDIQKQIAMDLVVQQYTALAKMAVIRARQTNKPVPLHLTLVGGGAFNNDPSVLRKALEETRKIVKGENVHLYVHTYKGPKEDKRFLQDLIDDKVEEIDSDQFFALKAPVKAALIAPKAAAPAAAPKAAAPAGPKAVAAAVPKATAPTAAQKVVAPAAAPKSPAGTTATTAPNAPPTKPKTPPPMPKTAPPPLPPKAAASAAPKAATPAKPGLTAFPKKIPLNRENFTLLGGVRVPIGATTMRLLANDPTVTTGITTEQAKRKVGLANCEMHKNKSKLAEPGGMTIYIPDKAYAQKLQAAIKDEFARDSCVFSIENPPVENKFGKYHASITLKDPAAVQIYIEKICKYGSIFTENLYEAEEMTHLIPQEPPKAATPAAASKAAVPAAPKAVAAAVPKAAAPTAAQKVVAPAAAPKSPAGTTATTAPNAPPTKPKTPPPMPKTAPPPLPKGPPPPLPPKAAASAAPKASAPAAALKTATPAKPVLTAFPKKPIPLNREDFTLLGGVRVPIGATTMRLLANDPTVTTGITTEQAKRKVGLANCEMHKNKSKLAEPGGMTIYIPDKAYAQKLQAAIKDEFAKNGCVFRIEDPPVENKFGKYHASITLKDPAAVQIYIEKICKYGSIFTENLYEAEGMTHLLPQEPPKPGHS